ncbi:MAG TPA: hypothetical protein VM493_04870, partial [Vicinamibacterales bacterium]|nr:hypothetical protein [Vicinamibacterales bacterium]
VVVVDVQYILDVLGVLASKLKQRKASRLVRCRSPRLTVVVDEATDRERLKEPRPKRSGRTAEPSCASVRTVINDLARILSAIHRSTIDRHEAAVRHPDVALGELASDALEYAIVREEVITVPEDDHVFGRGRAHRLNHIGERTAATLPANNSHARVASEQLLGNVCGSIITRVIDPRCAEVDSALIK